SSGSSPTAGVSWRASWRRTWAGSWAGARRAPARRSSATTPRCATRSRCSRACGRTDEALATRGARPPAHRGARGSRRGRVKPAYVLAIDQGTTGSTALLLDAQGEVRGRGYAELPQHFPRPGWVEHDGEEIWESVLSAVRAALQGADAPGIAAIGITNQRETTLMWERKSGRPVARAIVWQDRRTSDRCAALKRQGLERTIRSKTGLVLDPYFSATKLEWLLRHV